MGNKIAREFAVSNLRANRLFSVPFVLANGFLTMLLFIVVSLLWNNYVRTRHEDLLIIMKIAVTVTTFLAGIFAIYSNRFQMKRRYKEMALYGILGLEKKHIKKVLFYELLIEYFAITLISILGGFIFGKLSFLGINKLLQDTGTTLMSYDFSTKTAFFILIFEAVMMILLYVFNAVSVSNRTPIELMSYKSKGDTEPKVKKILFIVGVILLFVGYYIALRTKGGLEAISKMFPAIIVVIIATYLLFMTLTIAVLKLKKKSKNYYKANNFISTSGMLFRMKSNSIGLASLTILACGVIVSLSATASIYGRIDSTIKMSMAPRDYEIEVDKFEILTPTELNATKALLDTAVNNSLIDKEEETDAFTYSTYMMPALIDKGKISEIPKENYKTKKDIDKLGYVFFISLDDYNKRAETHKTLKKGEVLLASNAIRFLNFENLNIAGKNYKTKKADTVISSRMGVEYCLVVVPNGTDLYSIVTAVDKQKVSQLQIFHAMNIKNGNSGIKNRIDNNMTELRAELNSAPIGISTFDDTRKLIYQLNGGFLFLGILVSIIFLIGTILITYYKQISEAYEDRDKYQIMKKVGLSDALIRKSANKQIVWMFMLPLVVAAVHVLVASRLISGLLTLFGWQSYMNYLCYLFAVVGIFAIIYLLIFKITSNIYYKIVR